MERRTKVTLLSLMTLQDGTYGGNDSIVAFARLHKLTVVIHQRDSPAWEVHGESVDGTTSSTPVVRQLHISYHNGDHYASVRKMQDKSDSPANVHMSRQQAPGPDAESSQTPSSTDTHKRTSTVFTSLSCLHTLGVLPFLVHREIFTFSFSMTLTFWPQIWFVFQVMSPQNLKLLLRLSDFGVNRWHGTYGRTDRQTDGRGQLY